MLDKCLAGGYEDDEFSGYEEVCRQSCKEENMSVCLWNIHPNLRLRPPTEGELRDFRTSEVLARRIEIAVASLLEVMVDQVVTSLEVNIRGDSEGLFVTPEAEYFQVRHGETDQTPTPEQRHLPLNDLPPHLLARILGFALSYKGRLVHCISRLDPHKEPVEPLPPMDKDKRSGLLHRFHVGGSSCSITFTTKPNNLLAPLLVSKAWLFLGVHAFYGQNTFAFSSLGEFARFCKGTGQARIQRIQYVEILLIGNQYICNKAKIELPPPDAGPLAKSRARNTSKYVSLRSSALAPLVEMPRLKDLVFHVPETDKDYIRRGHERAREIKYMTKHTQEQPTYRKFRSLRTLQGLDYILQLRSMERVMFYDFSRFLQVGGSRHPVRDWTFFMDVENNTRMPKPPDKALKAQLRQLRPLMSTGMSEPYFKAVEPFYQNSNAFDEPGPRADNTIDAPANDDEDHDLLDRESDTSNENDDLGSDSDSSSDAGSDGLFPNASVSPDEVPVVDLTDENDHTGVAGHLDAITLDDDDEEAHDTDADMDDASTDEDDNDTIRATSPGGRDMIDMPPPQVDLTEDDDAEGASTALEEEKTDLHDELKLDETDLKAPDETLRLTRGPSKFSKSATPSVVVDLTADDEGAGGNSQKVKDELEINTNPPSSGYRTSQTPESVASYLESRGHCAEAAIDIEACLDKLLLADTGTVREKSSPGAIIEPRPVCDRSFDPSPPVQDQSADASKPTETTESQSQAGHDSLEALVSPQNGTSPPHIGESMPDLPDRIEQNTRNAINRLGAKTSQSVLKRPGDDSSSDEEQCKRRRQQ